MLAVASLALTLALTAGDPGRAHAQIGRGILELKASESLDPVSGGGDVAYGISIKNTGSIRAKNVVVKVPLPAGTSFVKCSTTPSSPIVPCALSNGTVSTTFEFIKAHATVKLSVTLRMPVVSAQSQVSVFIDANGDRVDDNTLTVTTTVVPPTAAATYLPSGRVVTVECGDVLDGAAFGVDTELRLDASLGCAGGPLGLRVAASNKTVDLNRNKILGPASGPWAPGSAGIVVAAGKTNVTIRGGSTSGTSGIEYFDWCVADEGGNTGLVIEKLRCFRARSAGLDLISSNVTVIGALVDKVVGTSKTTFEPPGGVGIRVTGDNVLIHNTRVRRIARIGVWPTGADADGNGVTITIDGNTSTSRIESNAGIGILVDGEKLLVKDTLVTGDGTEGVSTDGVVVDAAAVGTVLDGVEIKHFAGNGFVVAGAGTRVTRGRVESVAADGYVITGAGVIIDNNESRAGRHGYVLSGADIIASTNLAEAVGGDGFVVDGERARIDNSKAQGGAGHGFVLGGPNATLNTNTAELNDGNGFHITGAGGNYSNNRAKTNGAIGIQVLGAPNTFSTNLAELSAGFEWSIGPNNTDGGSNKANGSPCTFSAVPWTQTCEGP